MTRYNKEGMELKNHSIWLPVDVKWDSALVQQVLSNGKIVQQDMTQLLYKYMWIIKAFIFEWRFEDIPELWNMCIEIMEDERFKEDEYTHLKSDG